MFDYLYEWIRNIAFYMILSTVFLEAIPANTYKKYIRFVTGMILVLLLMTPVLKICKMEYPVSIIKDRNSYEEELEKMEELIQEAEVREYEERNTVEQDME